jgi:predicted nuclease with TOPRIM domain
MSAFDREILMRNLPEDIKPLVDQVSANVTDAVQRVVSEFKTQAGKIADEMEMGRFPAELQARLGEISAAHAAEFEQLRNSTSEVAALAADLRKLEEDFDPKQLQRLTAELATRTTALQRRLEEFREKTKALGEKSGKLAASAAFRLFTGGVA